MHYVMSDLHGRFDKYSKMLETIGFCENDTLYILGDVVDRGQDGIRILLDLASRPNIVPLIGNHDRTALFLLGYREKLIEKLGEKKLLELFELWLSDGGLPTYRQFCALDEKERRDAIGFIKEMKYFCELQVNGNRFFLAHTVPEYDGKPLAGHEDICFISGEPDYGTEYCGGVTVVTGHTPTELIDPAYKGRIWRGNGHIALDCGAGFDGRLGCLRLDDMKEYYV